MFTPISSFLVLPLRGQWVFVVPFLVGDMVGTSWRCRYCDGFNPRGVDWCQQCGRAFIPNLRQVLFQDQATPVFTPMGGWGAGPGKGTGGEGKGWGKGYGGGGGKDQKGKGGPAGNLGNFGFWGPYGQFGKGDPAGKAGKGDPKGSFGKGDPLGNFGNFGKGWKGDFKGGGPGGANGMGPFAPPGTPGPASLWRGARRKRRKGNPAWDAACAAELVGDGAESLVSALETKDSGKCFAASRHLSGVAAWQRQVCPAAADACLAQAKELSQRGQDLMPPAQQVATLERQLRGKLAEAEKLQQQHSTLLASLDAVAKEGAELERQLEFAKAKSAAAASAPPSVVAPNDFASALQFFLQASTRFLPPEQAGAFGSSLESIQRGLIGDSHPTVPSPMDVGITPSMEMDGTSVPITEVPEPPGQAEAVGEFPTDWVEPSTAERVPDTVVAPTVGAAASGSRVRGRSVATLRDIVDPSRARGASPPPAAGRSRSAGRDRTLQDANDFIARGSRYFSQAAERAGLNDV